MLKDVAFSGELCQVKCIKIYCCHVFCFLDEKSFDINAAAAEIDVSDAPYLEFVQPVVAFGGSVKMHVQAEFTVVVNSGFSEFEIGRASCRDSEDVSLLARA